MSTTDHDHETDVSLTQRPLRARVSAILDDLLPREHRWQSTEFTVAQIRVRLRDRGLLEDTTHAPPVRDSIIRDVLRDRDAYREPTPTTPADPTNPIETVGALVAHQQGRGDAR